MSIRNPLAVHWLMTACLGMAVVTACAAREDTVAVTPTSPATLTPVATATASLRLAAGAIEAQDEKGAWAPIGGQTTFDLVGELENTDPWMVTGNTFAVRESTHLADGLQAGDLVRVKGVILEDATWLAETIEVADEPVDPTITLIGKVNSVDPWAVGGMMLDVTGNTRVTGKVMPGMIVRVKILLLDDGHWNILSLASLSSFTEIPGCTTVTAIVSHVSKDEVQFAGWPPLPFDEPAKVEDEAGNRTMLSAGHLVLVVVCPTEAGRFMITKIIVP